MMTETREQQIKRLEREMERLVKDVNAIRRRLTAVYGEIVKTDGLHASDFSEKVTYPVEMIACGLRLAWEGVERREPVGLLQHLIHGFGAIAAEYREMTEPEQVIEEMDPRDYFPEFLERTTFH